MAMRKSLGVFASSPHDIGASNAMAREKTQDLHRLRQLEQKFRVPFEMMYLGGIAAREPAHGFDASPIGNRHKLGFVLAVLTERLDT